LLNTFHTSNSVIDLCAHALAGDNVKDPCNPECKEYGLCKKVCNAFIVYHKEYVDFIDFRLCLQHLEPSVHGEFDPKYRLVTIDSESLIGVEDTLGHEIEHVVLYFLFKKLGLTVKHANFGCRFVSESALCYDDNLFLLDQSRTRCGLCHRKLTPKEIGNGFSLDDEKTLLCEDCQSKSTSPY
jgi:hypothetical protein